MLKCLLLLILSSFAYGQVESGQLITADILNSQFSHIKTELNKRDIPYEFNSAIPNRIIRSNKINENFLKILLIDSSITLHTFQENQAIEAAKFNYNLSQVNNLIETKLSKVSCVINNGVGFQHYNPVIKTWDDTCVVDSCSEGYYPNQANTQCILNNSLACTNQVDESFNTIGYGFLSYDNQTNIESCKIKTCFSSAYQIQNGQCECVNENECLVSLSQVNSDLDEVNASLTSASQPEVSKVSTTSALNITTLNSSLSNLTKYDPNNLLTAFSTPTITKAEWSSKALEAKRLAQSYLNTCLNMDSFNAASNGSTCDLASKLKSNLDFLNLYFPFYGDSQATFSLNSGSFVSQSILTNILNTFNNKTNKITPITTYGAMDTINSTNLNTNLNNLRTNIQNKLEVTTGTYATEAVSAINGFNAQDTNRGQSLYFKIKNPSMKSTTINYLASGVSCVHNEYCKVYFPNHNTDTFQLAGLTHTAVDNSTVAKNVNLIINNEQVTAPYRTGRHGGCSSQSSVYASHPDRNIWACEDKGKTCTKFCYAGNCYTGQSSPVNVFNDFFNTQGKYIYYTWYKDAGDLRSGCSGNFVYWYIVYYYKKVYYISP